jgi:putative phosphoesterase
MSFDHLLPPGLDAGQVATRIGLLSDTHMPQRRRVLPPALFDLFDGADLLLHAGDVGELWVLDQLSAIAPVIAVHGNDDTADAQRELPYQQVVMVDGLRILLWHSHYPDWDEEMASRKANNVIPQRTVERAQRCGARLAVFGHWHIPLIYETHGVVAVNPGALASGNVFTRQVVQTVALLFVDSEARPRLVHVALDAPDRPYVAAVDWEAGFAAALAKTSASIVTPELAAAAAFLRPHLTLEELMLVGEPIAALAHPIWAGEQATITLAQVESAVQAAQLPASLKQRFADLLAEWRAQPA